MTEIVMHKAISFTETLCGVPTNTTNIGWTNINSKVDCPDCLKII